MVACVIVVETYYSRWAKIVEEVVVVGEDYALMLPSSRKTNLIW